MCDKSKIAKALIDAQNKLDFEINNQANVAFEKHWKHIEKSCVEHLAEGKFGVGYYINDYMNPDQMECFVDLVKPKMPKYTDVTLTLTKSCSRYLFIRFRERK